MPRTKQRQVRGANADVIEIEKNFRRLADIQIRDVRQEYKKIRDNYCLAIDKMINQYPTEFQEMTLGELFKLDLTPQKENRPAKTPKTVKKPSRLPTSTSKRATKRNTTAISDDGYQSESINSQATSNRVGPSIAKKPRRSRSYSRHQLKETALQRSKSEDRNQRQLTLSSAKKNNNLDVLKTPLTKNNKPLVITPKIKMNAPINVLRKPKDGEMVFSTQGSPLLVSTTATDKLANVNVPLRDGKIVALLPYHDTSLTENLTLDDETRQQLQILQNHLSKVLK